MATESTASLEDSEAASYEAKHTPATGCCCPTPRYLPKRNEVGTSTQRPVHSAFICYGPHLETIQASISQ